GRDGFLDAVLDDRLVDQRQHLLRLRLGGRQEPRTEAGGGKDGFAHGGFLVLSHRHAIVSRDAARGIAGRVMLDAAVIRENLPQVEARLRARGLDPSRELAALVELGAERRRLIPLIETLKRASNEAAESVARAKREGRDPSEIFAANKARA